MYIRLFRYVLLLVVFYVLGVLSYSFFATKTSLLLPQRASNSDQINSPGANGSRLIYPKFPFQDMFTGSGETTIDVKEEATVISKTTRKSISVPVENIGQYKAPEYTATIRKAKKNVLVYSVGYMKGWETISGSKDRLIVLADPKNQQKEYKYRVAFETSSLFAGNETKFGVQNLARVGQEQLNHIQIMKKPVMSQSEAALNNVVAVGDVVIVIPVSDLVESVKSDGTGHILADWIYVRRFNGTNDFTSSVRQLFYE